MADELNTEGAAQANPDEAAGGNEAGEATANPEEKGGESAETNKESKGEVPESYDLKLPDNMLISDEYLTVLKAEAKKKGLTNEAAQEYLDSQHRAVDTYHQSLMGKFEAERDGWVKTAEADKEIGGDGFKENVEVSRRLIKEVASKEFYEKVLAPKSEGGLGYGDHPEMVRIFTRLAKKGFAEDKAVHGTGANAENQSLEKRLYPDLA